MSQPGEWIADAEFPLYMPPVMSGLAAFGGLRVVESPLLKYDEMMVARDQQAIVVGEIAHFKYRIHQLNRNHECRNIAEVRLRNFAHRVLGERWKLSSD